MELGNLSNVKWIDWGPGYRLYVTQGGDQLIILFVGGTKKRQPSDNR
jgi:putative addiction module killer protein